MIEVVEKYKTFDGKLFDTEHQAKTHTIDKVREVLDQWITPRIKGISRVDSFSVVMAVAPDYESVYELMGKLSIVL